MNVDGCTATHLALKLLRREDLKWRAVTVRSSRYLNNIVEQDHRAIKRRCAAMLGLKGFRTAQVTLAGVELAHRIRKQQFLLSHDDGARCSLKDLWSRALTPGPNLPPPLICSHAPGTADAPELKRRPARRALSEERLRQLTAVRYARKFSDSGGLYLLVAPSGGRYWRYAYRIEGKYKTIALGLYPDVSLAKARSRHQEARSLLADGVDPATIRNKSR